MQRRALLTGAIAGSLLVAFSALSGCDGEAKAAQAAANEGLTSAMEVVERDTAQLRSGMPEGVKVLQKRMPGDPLAARLELQNAIKAARENTDNLAIAKSTFFSFADVDGKVLRSEIDPDRLVDQNILTAYPDLKRALEPNSGLIEAYGPMEALRGVKRGEDTAWVVAHRAVDAEGKLKGLFLSGWSFRFYAGVIQNAVRAKFTEAAKTKDNKKVPVIYAYVVKGALAYGEPDAPETLAEHVSKLDVLKLTEAGDYSSSAVIEKRTFGFAGRRAPALGPDAAVVIVASVF